MYLSGFAHFDVAVASNSASPCHRGSVFPTGLSRIMIIVPMRNMSTGKKKTIQKLSPKNNISSASLPNAPNKRNTSTPKQKNSPHFPSNKTTTTTTKKKNIPLHQTNKKTTTNNASPSLTKVPPLFKGRSSPSRALLVQRQEPSRYLPVTGSQLVGILLLGGSSHLGFHPQKKKWIIRVNWSLLMCDNNEIFGGSTHPIWKNDGNLLGGSSQDL